MQTPLTLHYLGVGNAKSHELGNSSCVLEKNHKPLLMIDCGPIALQSFSRQYPQPYPTAIFITHAHMDHVGGLEELFFCSHFDESFQEKIKLFVPVKLVDVIHRRIADFPGNIAEGGVNFWDAFQLIPVSDRFWLDELCFDVFPVRHHEFQSAYGIALQGLFLFSGDTCPIPEIINRFACHGEMIFHDCCIENNPSHTSVSQIAAYYKPEQIQRMVFYHYDSEEAGREIERYGYRIARQSQSFVLRNAGLSLLPSLSMTNSGFHTGT